MLHCLYKETLETATFPILLVHVLYYFAPREETLIHLRLNMHKSSTPAYRTFHMQHTPSLKFLSRQIAGKASSQKKRNPIVYIMTIVYEIKMYEQKLRKNECYDVLSHRITN